jgi:hypothetical protein
MASAIRKIGLKLIVWMVRIFARPAVAGWKRSRRPASLRGR